MTKFPIVEVKHAQVSGLPTVCDAAGLSLWNGIGCHTDASALNQYVACANTHLVASCSDHRTCAADRHSRAADGDTPARGYANAAPRRARRRSHCLLL